MSQQGAQLPCFEERVEEIIAEALADSSRIKLKFLKNKMAEAKTTKSDAATAGDQAAAVKQEPTEAVVAPKLEPLNEIHCAECNQTFQCGDFSYTEHLDAFECKPHQCATCLKKFKALTGAETHWFAVHSTDAFRCDEPKCRAAFASLEKLIKHQNRIHHNAPPTESEQPSAKRMRHDED